MKKQQNGWKSTKANTISMICIGNHENARKSLKLPAKGPEGLETHLELSEIQFRAGKILKCSVYNLASAQAQYHRLDATILLSCSAKRRIITVRPLPCSLLRSRV